MERAAKGLGCISLLYTSFTDRREAHPSTLERKGHPIRSTRHPSISGSTSSIFGKSPTPHVSRSFILHGENIRRLICPTCIRTLSTKNSRVDIQHIKASRKRTPESTNASPPQITWDNDTPCASTLFTTPILQNFTLHVVEIKRIKRNVSTMPVATVMQWASSPNERIRGMQNTRE